MNEEKKVHVTFNPVLGILESLLSNSIHCWTMRLTLGSELFTSWKPVMLAPPFLRSVRSMSRKPCDRQEHKHRVKRHYRGSSQDWKLRNLSTQSKWRWKQGWLVGVNSRRLQYDVNKCQWQPTLQDSVVPNAVLLYFCSVFFLNLRLQYNLKLIGEYWSKQHCNCLFPYCRVEMLRWCLLLSPHTDRVQLWILTICVSVGLAYYLCVYLWLIFGSFNFSQFRSTVKRNESCVTSQLHNFGYVDMLGKDVQKKNILYCSSIISH